MDFIRKVLAPKEKSVDSGEEIPTPMAVNEAPGVTFKVSDVKIAEREVVEHIPLADYIKKRCGGKAIYHATEHPDTVQVSFSNAFVSTALAAYNQHRHLILKPDDVWIAIMTAFSQYVDKHAEEMRHLLVSHSGKEELVVVGAGTITTANYDHLLDLMSDLIDSKTKDEVRGWIECNFSTTDILSRSVSKLILMATCSHYFTYTMKLRCGLPAVTLQGTLEDWKEIRKRAERLANWESEDLAHWSKVLCTVLDKFVQAYEDPQNVDRDFWNRIATIHAGGSRSPHIEGWILAFVPFTEAGKPVLNSIETIEQTKQYGKVDTNDIPTSVVQVPVKIDDNGTIYNTTFYSGAIMMREKKGCLSPSIDWCIVDNEK
eukprot:Colp12_sorted_trinity150504_noHs@21062